jgi:hypothetical protein
MKIAKTGALETMLAGPQNYSEDWTGLNLYGPRLYWWSASTVMSVPRGNADDMETLTTEKVTNEVVDDTSVYWMNPANGTVVKMTPK